MTSTTQLHFNLQISEAEFSTYQQFVEPQKYNIEIDEDIPSVDTSPIPKQNAIDIVGSITRQRAKQLEKKINAQVNANLSFVTNNVEDFIDAFRLLLYYS